MSQYSYDEQGQVFPFFFLTILLLGLVPSTYSFASSSKEPKIQNIWGDTSKDAPVRKSSTPWYSRLTKGHLALVVGWAGVIYLSVKLANVDTSVGKQYDPYEILGLSTSATADQIRKHYKKLSIKFHPDKIRQTVNQTREEIETHYVELTKAYKALTDEEIRHNYMEYGHPDGKQDFSKGIALPQWIVDYENNYIVLAFYGLIFGILLPYSVGSWWYGSRSQTKDRINVNSAAELFKNYEQKSSFDQSIDVIARADEFKALIGKDTSKKSRAKVRELLYSHIHREKPEYDDDEELRMRETVLRHFPRLVRAKLMIDSAFEFLEPCLSTLNLSKSVIQALPAKSNPILQLPFADIASEKIDSNSLKSVRDLLRMDTTQQKKVFSELTDSQFQRMIEVAKKFPVPELVGLHFEVPGDSIITPDSILQFRMVLRCSTADDAVRQSKLKGGPKDRRDYSDSALSESERHELAEVKDETPAAYAPRLPFAKKPTWWILVSVPRSGKLLFPPVSVTDFGKEPRSFDVQIKAPNRPECLHLEYRLICDSYFDCDIVRSIELEIEDPSKLVDDIQEDEISDPEEDSFAGQMQQMRGGKTKSPRIANGAGHAATDNDDDDESLLSDLDDEDEDAPSLNDYNTDSDKE